MSHNEMIHVAFRDASTGRFLFHARYPARDVRKWEAMAAVLGISMDELVHRAIVEEAARQGIA